MSDIGPSWSSCFSLYIYIEKFKNFLVRNKWTNFNIAWQECFFGDPLPRLFKPAWFVTSPLISGPAWTLRLQFTKYQQSYAPMKIFKKNFFVILLTLYIWGALNYIGAILCATSYYLPQAYNALLGSCWLLHQNRWAIWIEIHCSNRMTSRVKIAIL